MKALKPAYVTFYFDNVPYRIGRPRKYAYLWLEDKTEVEEQGNDEL